MNQLNFPLLSILLVLPVAGAILVALLPRGRDGLVKGAAFATTLVVLVLSLLVASSAQAFRCRGFMSLDPSYRAESDKDYIHICDVDDMIARLVKLKEMAKAHFGEDWA